MEKKVEDALNSLDHATRVGPGPFFYTRVEARLNKKERTAWEKISGFIARPAIALSVVCLIISINTVVIFRTKSSPSFTEQKNSMLSEDADADIFAFYDEENSNADTQ